MSADNKRVSLAADIVRVLGSQHVSAQSSGMAGAKNLAARGLLVTGIALAVMQAQPAQAVSLGELRVQSGLGQPLVATTTARLGPGERIEPNCVSAPAANGGGLSSPASIKVSAQNGTTAGSYSIQVRTTQPLHEPMYEIRLQVDCPGGVALSKSYVVMLNLPMAAPMEPVITQSRDTAAARETTNTATAQQSNRTAAPARSNSGRLAVSRAAIPAGQAYRVRNGDTLSAIAERVENRPVGSTWRVADMLFAANPRAFIRGDRNMIKLGAVLDIPTVAELRGAVARNTPAPAPAAHEQTPVSGTEGLNITLGRPEETPPDTGISNTELLREIREVNPVQNETPGVTEAAANLNAATTLPTAAASPFADAAAATQADTAADAVAETTVDTAATTAEVNRESPQQSGMNPFFAALAGIFMGALLALVMLGRRILGPLLEGRARRKAALENTPAAARSKANAADFAPVRPAYGGGGIDVEIGETEQPAASDVDIDLFAAPTDNTADSAHFDVLLDGLDSEDELTDKTARFEAPPLNTPLDATAEHATESMETTGTMCSLFDDTARAAAESKETAETPDTDNTGETAEMPDDSASATAELPAVDSDEVADIDISDLESLSRQLQETQDNKLSATLTQALGLLEQDYEDEMTASQILEQQDANKTVSQHKVED